MINARFQNGVNIKALILDKRVKEVQGVAECIGCGKQIVIINPDNPSGFASKFGEWMAREIEIFAFGHICLNR